MAFYEDYINGQQRLIECMPTEIHKVHLEITQRCNAACPMCDRNHNGGEVNRHIRDDCRNYHWMILKLANFIKQLNTMYMCGNLGDPISASDTLEVFRYFREHNPNMWLSMNTNAGARDPEWWADVKKAIGKMGCVIFSVDGLEETNHLYRQNVRWEFVERT